MTHRRLALIAALLLAVPACKTAPTSFANADVSSIRALDDEFARMAVAGDYTTLVKRFYSDDAMFMAPNATAAVGHAQIEAALRQLPPLSKFTLQSDDNVGVGDLAYSCGAYAKSFSVPGQGTTTDNGKFVVIYRKRDGTWKVTRDIFNSDLPLPDSAGKQAATPGTGKAPQK